MHQTCRSCHVPPPEPASSRELTDCAVCHGPERSPESIYRLLPSDRALTPVLRLEEGVPAAFRDRLLAALEDTAVRMIPDGLVVEVEVALRGGPARTDRGVAFEVRRAGAEIRLHRATVRVEGPPGVGRTAAEAEARALDLLLPKLVLALTW